MGTVVRKETGIMRQFTIVLVAAVFAAACWSSTASAQTDRDRQSVQDRADRLDEYLTRLSAFDAFDGVVLVAEGEDVLLAKGFGLADREAMRPWTPDTVSTIGSITKQFTGAAITLLVQRGELDFSDTIGDYFPDAPEDKSAITIHELLTHSSGLPGAVGADEEQIDRDAYLSRAFEAELSFDPGDRYDYSNVGYSVLGAILELVTGSPYEVFVRDNLFLPAGMNDTGYVLPGWGEERIAIGYRGDRRWGTVVEHQGADGFSWHLVGNGGMHSTVRDMHRWWLAIRDNTILDEQHTEMFLAPHQDEGGGDSFYGYGWVNMEAPNGERMITHDGGNGFLGGDCAFYPESDIFICLLANDTSQTSYLWNSITTSVAGGELRLPPDPATVDIDALNRVALERAKAYVQAFNQGGEAIARYGAEHRADRGQDEALNQLRVEQGNQLLERFGELTLLSEESSLPGQAVLRCGAATTKQILSIRFVLSPESRHLVEQIGLSMDG
jgi:CubicO group peptidase (beta-lactamase class C family)